MKKHGAALLILTMVAFTGMAYAQRGMTAQVPFDFIANGKTMPAGMCRVEIQDDGQAVVWITSGNKHLLALPLKEWSSSPSQKTALVFHKYGDRYFLAGVKREGLKEIFELRPGKVERELRAQTVEERDITILASAE